MPPLQPTQVYLEREQKQALQALAAARGTKVAEEVRRAVDAYVTGVSPEELRLLDAGTRCAGEHLQAMAGDIDRRLVRIETCAEIAAARPAGIPKLSGPA
jgi:hypothetical protein